MSERSALGQFIAGNPGGPGRLSEYDPDKHPQLAYKICLLGATSDQLADVLGIARSTLYKWMTAHPEFDEAVHRGKSISDMEVQHSLRGRAIGFTATDITTVDKGDNDPVTTTTIKQYPPDSTACIFWLHNRQSADWKQKQTIDHTGNVGVTQLLDAIDGTNTGLPAEDDPYLDDEAPEGE